MTQTYIQDGAAVAPRLACAHCAGLVTLLKQEPAQAEHGQEVGR